MCKHFSILLLLPLLTLLFTSCESDFDLTADYQENTIVYGLLSQNDTVHYLRITKAFLGDGDALIYASIPDSSSYGTDIEVKMIETTESGIQRTLFFDTVTIHNKEEGVFYAPDQLMYKTEAILDEKSSFQLLITNKITGKEVKSSTNLIYDLKLSRPPSINNNPPRLDFKRDTFSIQKIEWSSAINGRLYQPALRFYFKEVNLASDTILRRVDWIFSQMVSEGLKGGEKMVLEFRSEDFFRLCENQIPYSDPDKENDVNQRLADHFDIEFIVVGDEFKTYLDVNGPTTGLLLERPSYTNIENGLGLFSSRFTKIWYTRVGDNIKADLMNKTNLHFFAN